MVHIDCFFGFNSLVHMKYFLFLGIFLNLVSCNKDKVDSFKPIDNGIYSGIFERDSYQANVTLTFNDSLFQGSSNVSRFPAICQGVFKQSTKTIDFANKCVWTADFDWTLIMSGTFEYSYDGTNLTFWKDRETYKLTKQK